MDSQVIELLGRHRLADELLMAGLEVAYPARDRGVDVIAYADLDEQAGQFVACPIQMKAASGRRFGVHQKYAKFPGLLLAYVWNLRSPDEAETFALTYPEAVRVAEAMGWTETSSWTEKGGYSSKLSVRLAELLEPYRMTPDRWYEKVLTLTGRAV
ncbi:hypothetical protein B1759_11055 [Rubrivirga sp. SAORIC476]|nr:hypothetical protein B1759_11055 [Rubrivirga sp. SAORIC476]